MEFFGPLCTAILPFSPSGTVIIELTFITDNDKTTFWGSCDKRCASQLPPAHRAQQIKTELIPWTNSLLLTFRGLESPFFLASPEA